MAFSAGEVIKEIELYTLNFYGIMLVIEENNLYI